MIKFVLRSIFLLLAAVVAVLYHLISFIFTTGLQSC